ncbi:magnesium transporter CorA family protein [Pseudomonas citronellolis]|uniref:magnesium transporter CorA family protein n=1 Tax=Pseudomonas citronellolis TaxID=53408 RepID=UPI0021C108AD|nr:magnesium transporter CorA family protein [Pseudomonas citronellolis]UXJ50127.1 magnesium transporter CorA family protein [Pseudomonas citronellolis]
MRQSYLLVGGALLPCDDEAAQLQLCIAPDEYERAWLQRRFNLAPHALASALDPDEVSRVEFHPGSLFLIWKRPENYSGNERFAFEVSSFGLLLDTHQLVLISKTDSLLDGLPARHDLHQPLDVLLALLLSQIHHYQGHLKVIKLVARELQQRFNQSMHNQHLLQMFGLSESLVYYLNAIQSNGTVLGRLRSQGERLGFDPASLALLDDLIIENEQCVKQAEIYSSVLAGLMDARGNLLNTSMNEMLRKLTLINVVFLPLNLIAGIGGMSEFSMMTHGIPWWLSYPLFIAALAALAGLMLLALRRLPGTPSARPGG